MPKKPAKKTETATFGAGCFWGIEETFRTTKGVTGTAVGYMGGTLANPKYEDVCSGATGHAEIVQVVFDPTMISYDEILKIFWANHNPTSRNRQGSDIGDQYRSAIFYHSPTQKKLAEASKQALENSHTFKKPTVTEITKTSEFYRAEDYHQQYLSKRGLSACHL